MFKAREKEKKDLISFIASKDTKAALVYGIRRVGKTTLILESLRQSNVEYIYYECIKAPEDINLGIISQKVSKQLGLPEIVFKNFLSLFEYLESLERTIVFVLDEYQYLKQGFKSCDADSLFQHIIDGMKPRIKIIFSGSYVSMMKELLDYGNPLFGRFQLVEKLDPMDYYDSSLFYDGRSCREKICFYSVFGGSPLSSSSITSSSLEENIINLILSPKGVLRLYIQFILFSELRKVDFANRILEVLGNGKKRYSEIENALNISSSGALAKQLSCLEEMEIIRKVVPINSKCDKRKTFYAISDNLIRFYYCYVYRNLDEIARLGERSFFSLYIKPGLDTFISYRFEDICKEYFSRLAHKWQLPGLMDIGTYWYDDKIRKTNGEFDIALEYNDGYEIWEAKFLKSPMPKSMIEKEVDEIKQIGSMQIRAIGVISSSGFESTDSNYKYLNAEDLYKIR